MGRKAEDGTPTPVRPQAKIPRVNGVGHYEKGDRILAHDVARGGVLRAGVVGHCSTEPNGKDYMVVQYGDEPFIEGFICTADDVESMLPDPEDMEQLEQWLESGA